MRPMNEDPDEAVGALFELRKLRQASHDAGVALAALGDQLTAIVTERLVRELEWELRLQELGIDFDLLRIFDPE